MDNLFYINGTVDSETCTLDPKESKHVVKVLRLGKGDELWLTDGLGNIFRSVITVPDIAECTVRVVSREKAQVERSYKLTMAVSPTKNPERYEWFLEKATEVGCDTFIPVVARHSERRIFKHERAEKVILSAMKQSLKLWRPSLGPVTPFLEILKTPFEGLKLIAHCRDGERTNLKDVLGSGRDILVLIGPEGDFSDEEVTAAVERGFIPVSLGEARLRTETAALYAVVAVSLING